MPGLGGIADPWFSAPRDSYAGRLAARLRANLRNGWKAGTMRS